MARATAEDVPRIVDLGEKFHAYSPWRELPYDREAVTEMAARLIEVGAVFATDDGIIGGAILPLWFAPSFKVGIELFWYAPKDGQGLRREFEAWCEAQGAYAAQCSGLADDHLPAVTRIFRRAGYEPGETVFIKRF